MVQESSITIQDMIRRT